MNTKSHKKMKGLSIFEGLLVFGLAAIVLVTALSYFNNATNTSKLNQAKAQVQAIGAGVQSLFSSQSTYATASTSLVVNAGLAPQNAVSGTTLVNPWGGQINVDGFARYFEVELLLVPSDSCVNFLSAGVISEGGIIQMEVNGSNTFTTSPNPAQAVSACNSNLNTMTFRFR